MLTIHYKTQSSDTSIEAELVRFHLWRQLTRAEKLGLVKQIARKGTRLILMGIYHQFPDIPITEIRGLYYRKRWGKLAEIDFKIQGELMLEDPIWLASYLGNLLESLGIPYYIGGSVASSLQGEVRFTEDLDLVIQIEAIQVQALINSLKDEFYISDIAVDEAMRGMISSFNIIHLQMMEKADIFLSRSDDFSVSKMMRRQLYTAEGEGRFYVCSPEDTVLQKLLWPRIADYQSQKQWRDILGVLKLQGERLDFVYLNDWGEKIEVKESLKMALVESGLTYLDE